MHLQQACWDAKGAMATTDFDRSVNPISTRGTIIPKHITTAPGFSDHPAALDSKNLKCQPQMNQVEGE